MLVGVWLDVANGHQLRGNAARGLPAAGAGQGICKLTGFRLPKETFLLPLRSYYLGHGT